MTTNKKSNNNVFQNIVRDVVKEELRPVREEFKKDISSLSAKVTTLDSKVTTLDSKVSTLDSKVSTLDSKFNNLNLKVNALDLKMDSVQDNLEAAFRKYVDEILVGQDQVMGELKTIRQEQIMHQGQHDDLNGLPEKVEKLAALVQAD